jgi:hypothetical protein
VSRTDDGRRARRPAHLRPDRRRPDRRTHRRRRRHRLDADAEPRLDARLRAPPGR